MSDRLEGVAWAAAIVLAAGAVYELLVATEGLSIGGEPGAGAPGSGVVLTASLLAYLVAAGTSFARSTMAGRQRAAVLAALPLFGAVYMAAHWLSFDPYYAPTLRRYSTGGVADPWILAVVLTAAVAATVAALVPRFGAVLGALVLLVEALTVFVMPLGK